VPEQCLELRKPRLCPGDRVEQDHSLNKSIRRKNGKVQKHTYSVLLYLPPSHYEVDEIVDGELDSYGLGKEMGCCLVLFSKLIERTSSKDVLGCGKEMLATSGIRLVMDSYTRTFCRGWRINERGHKFRGRRVQPGR
jgi:hypothetical protein